MALDFPDSPNVGDVYTTENKTWQWDGTAWLIKASNINTTVVDQDRVKFIQGVWNDALDYELLLTKSTSSWTTIATLSSVAIRPDRRYRLIGKIAGTAALSTAVVDFRIYREPNVGVAGMIGTSLQNLLVSTSFINSGTVVVGYDSNYDPSMTSCTFRFQVSKASGGTASIYKPTSFTIEELQPALF
jgi:hypothetical protein